MAAPAPGIIAPPMFAGMGGNPGAPYALHQFRLSGEAVIDQFESKAGFALARDYFALGQVADGAKGASAAQVVDLTDKLAPDGTLDWKAPALPKAGSSHASSGCAAISGSTPSASNGKNFT